MAVFTGKSSTPYARFFGDDAQALSKQFVLELDRKLSERETQLINMGSKAVENFLKGSDVRAARNDLRRIIGASLLPELSHPKDELQENVTKPQVSR